MKALFCALAVGMVPLAASAATYEEVADLVSVDAFDDADADWRRRVTQRVSECGYYGNQRETRRVDILVERFNDLADAVEANDQSGAMTAGKALYRTIDANARFTACWRHVSRRAGVSPKLTRMLKDI